MMLLLLFVLVSLDGQSSMAASVGCGSAGLASPAAGRHMPVGYPVEVDLIVPLQLLQLSSLEGCISLDRQPPQGCQDLVALSRDFAEQSGEVGGILAPWRINELPVGMHELRGRLTLPGGGSCALPPFTFRVAEPRLELRAPAEGALMRGGSLQVSVAITGLQLPRDGLLCVRLRGASKCGHYGVNGTSFVLGGVPPGHHVLQLLLVSHGARRIVSKSSKRSFYMLAEHSKQVHPAMLTLLADTALPSPLQAQLRQDTMEWIRHLPSREFRMFSQNGEDGVLEAIFEAIGSTNQLYAEFGVEDGSERNSRWLQEEHAWGGLLMDGSHTNLTINLRREIVTAENIEALFSVYGVPSRPDLISIDLDFNDFHVWAAIKSYQPRVVICEYNAAIPPNESRTVPYDASRTWDGTSYHGASLGALHKLARSKGYTLIYCEGHGVNAFFVRTDILGRDLYAEGLLSVAQVWKPVKFHGRSYAGHPKRSMETQPWQWV